MTNYSKGAAFERRVKKQLERLGYYVIRSAGSHGYADLAAFQAHRRPLLIQCKYGSEPDFKEEFHKLRALYNLTNARVVLAHGIPHKGVDFYDGITKEKMVIV